MPDVDTRQSSAVTDRDDVADLSRIDDVERLRVAVLRLARRVRTSSSGAITPSQLFVLATVIRHGRLTIGRIAELEQIKPPSASKIVSALETEGFVERSVDPGDRRCTHIVATGAGTAYLANVRAAGRTWIADRLDGLAAGDVDALGRALPALERLLQVDVPVDE